MMRCVGLMSLFIFEISEAALGFVYGNSFMLNELSDDVTFAPRRKGPFL